MWVIYNNASALYNHFPFLVRLLLICFLISEPGFSVVGAPFLHFGAREFRGGCGSSATLASPRCAVLLLCQLVARALRCARSVTGAGTLLPARRLGVENHNERKVTCKHPVTGQPSQDNCIFVVNEQTAAAMTSEEKKERPVSMICEATNYNLSSDYSAHPMSPVGRTSRSSKKVHNFGKRSNSIKRNPNAPVVRRGCMCSLVFSDSVPTLL
uniref:Uncharacterized protein n=1 Tax=Accipiter nisus TaxID=211598 RepID=A0A8B9NDS3_9AVES